MRDSEVVASIVAGDSLGLAAAYDRYADPLYQYSRTLLGDPADAADAVQDTFVIAASRPGGLRDPSRLRLWLYAVARNEALRILRSKKGTPALGEAPDVTGESSDVVADADRADLRALFEDAVAGLNPGEREVIELQLRQGLATAEVATVLGISRSHAHALLSRARKRLEACLAALLVGRVGRGECDELGAILADWDGRLTIRLRERVHRHIEHCATCGARRAHELRPAMLLDLSPSAALAAGAATSLRLARGAPDGLRAHTITLATGQGVGAVAHRAAVLSRAGAFNHGGFPQPAHGAKAVLAAHGDGGRGSGTGGGSRTGDGAGVKGAVRSSRRGVATVTAVVVIGAIIAAVAFALTGSTRTFKPAADPSPSAVTAAPAAATSAAASAGASTAARTTGPSATSAATSAAPTAMATTGPTAPTPAPESPTADPPSGTPATSPSASASTPAPTPGTLREFPDGGTLVLAPNGSPGRQIYLSGSGSGDWDVHWSVAVANDADNAISVSSSAGTLSPARSIAAVTITANQSVPCGSPRSPTITVSPGGAVFSVCTSGSRHFTGGVRGSVP